MSFRALVLNLDDTPDTTGESFGPDRTRIATGPVPVYLDFNYESSHRMGYATLEQEGDRVYAVFDFNTAWAHPEVLKKLTPAVGGVLRNRDFWYIGDDGRPVFCIGAVIHFLGLCTNLNCDRRIKTLGEQGFKGW